MVNSCEIDFNSLYIGGRNPQRQIYNEQTGYKFMICRAISKISKRKVQQRFWPQEMFGFRNLNNERVFILKEIS